MQDMNTVIQIGQVGLAILLIAAILMQHRGTGLGGAFGGQDLSYRSRRGIEKLLLRATILFAALFLVLAIAELFV